MMAFYSSINDGNNFVISFSTNPQQNFGVFAKGYKQAASVLVGYLLAKPRFSDYEAYPVVFLYRQAFELYLKGFYYRAALVAFFKDSQEFKNGQEIKNIEKNLNIHRLTPFAKAFKEICLVLFQSDQSLLPLAEKVNRFAVDFEKIDIGSYAYRYPINTKGKISTKRNQEVNLLALHESMQEFLGELEVVDLGFDIEAFKTQEIYEVMQKAQSIIAYENSEAG
jgi:hypothetical protein